MGIVTDLSPLNVHSQKELFFSDDTYNPQFEYSRTFSEDELSQWGLPDSGITEFAQSLIVKESDHNPPKTPFSSAMVTETIHTLFKEIGVEEEIHIVFDPKKLSRCSVSGTTIAFRDPPEFTDSIELQGTLNHEIQTHLLRNLNQLNQGWKVNRNQSPHLFLQTEEGLAVLHSVIDNPNKSIWRAGMYYFAASLAQKASFRDVYSKLIEFGIPQGQAWRVAVRTKRGLTDTAKVGGNTKDLCYLAGALKMWQWIMDENNNPQDLYLGKFFIEDLENQKNNATTLNVYLPTFMQHLDIYRSTIKEIGEYNTFQSVQP